LNESLVYAKYQQIIQRSGRKAREYWGRWGCLWFPGSRLAVNAVHCRQGARPLKVQYFASSVYYLISLPIGAIHRTPPAILTFNRILPSRAHARVSYAKTWTFLGILSGYPTRQNISIFQPFLDSLCKRRFPKIVSSFSREGCGFGVLDYHSAACFYRFRQLPENYQAPLRISRVFLFHRKGAGFLPEMRVL